MGTAHPGRDRTAIRRRRSAALIVVAAAGLIGCLPPARPHAAAPVSLGAGQTLLTGVIEIAPAPADSDYHFKHRDDWKGKAFLLVGDLSEPLPNPLTLSDYKDRIEVTLGKPFHVIVPSRPLHVRGIYVPMQVSDTKVDWIKLPARFTIPIDGSVRGAYMGRLRYSRDEYYAVTRVDLIDELELANAETTKRFGAFAQLRRAFPREKP